MTILWITLKIVYFYHILTCHYPLADVHITWLGAILYQGENFESLKPVAIASHCTNKAEKNYEQIDLKAMGIDFAVNRFLSYLVGS